MYRIRQLDLEILVTRINKATNSPIATCSKQTNKQTQYIQYVWNIGNYHLDYAYGGVKLVRTCNERGDISTVSTGGYGTKRDLYNWMQAFLAGIELK